MCFVRIDEQIQWRLQLVCVLQEHTKDDDDDDTPLILSQLIDS